ncbi:MAG: aminomethyl-transferring glycine dehydrogenase [Flavobacteriales bacterium]
MATNFQQRHIGSAQADINEMLTLTGAASTEQLVNNIVPQHIRLPKQLNLPAAMSESEYLSHITAVANKNKLFKSYIGLGYYGCITPPVILRNVFENPGWYTAYTPYQAEIAQGRLEALLNFQTMVLDLTGMDIANASLLDEATAAAEAMIMLLNSRSRDAVKKNANTFFVDESCFPQTIDVLKARTKVLGIELVVGDYKKSELNDTYFGALVQYPNAYGVVENYNPFVDAAHAKGVPVAVATDLLSLCLLEEPAKFGADIVFGNSQRFGVPMGFGGPHAAFFAAKDEYKRNMPGRIIGISIDARGKKAYRMALQTREQHIKRDKATSNICTAQALLAIMASMYAVYHGQEGIKSIATEVHQKASLVKEKIAALGLNCVSANYFDTLCIEADKALAAKIVENTLKAEINVGQLNGRILLAIDESTSVDDINKLLAALAAATGKSAVSVTKEQVQKAAFSKAVNRTSPYLTHPVFNTFHSETEMMRYIKRLENKDLSLVHSMISLGSCTMKLNAAAEMMPLSNPLFNGMHPFAPKEQTLGYQEVINDLGTYLKEITGFSGVSFQPNSGAQGELAGLLVIKAYLDGIGQTQRNIALIPTSAHGTNPASAAMAGMDIVLVKCDDQGNIDLQDLKEKAEQHKENLACVMVTYPSTHGVYEEGIKEITAAIHQYGGQVYMDGANMNAQVGLTNPANIGADVCHLNLHKTFAIPHGGGGPGMGPIGVAKHLVPYLPSHPMDYEKSEKGIPAVAAAPFSSALILLISYGYIRMLGTEGVTESTRMAMLNANYLKVKLENYYPVLYQGKNNKVAHEMILDCRGFKQSAGIEVMDIAKRLIDYGFHAPTVSFPVAGTLMIEPTESESKSELDRFCKAMIEIRKEIAEIEDGIADKENNVLKNSPHTLADILGDWQRPYSRDKAVTPLPYLAENKFWSTVNRIDNAYGDRNLVCSCVPTEEYSKELA